MDYIIFAGIIAIVVVAIGGIIEAILKYKKEKS